MTTSADTPQALAGPAADEPLVYVGASGEFPVGRFRIVSVGLIEVGVLRRPDGSWRAVRNSCPHRLAPICKGDVTGTILPSDRADDRVYGMDASVLRCPWHAYEFDLDTGRALYGTYPGRLRFFDVAVHDDRVYIRPGRRR